MTEHQEVNGNDRVPTHYELLGVHPESSLESIKAAWRVVARRTHPDRFAHLGHDEYLRAEQEMSLVTRAHAVLTDESTRRVYDLEIGVLPARCAMCGKPGRLRLGHHGEAVGACVDCYRRPSRAV